MRFSQLYVAVCQQVSMQIIRAMKVNELYMMKQYDEAVLAANDAKKWSIIGIVVGLIGSILYFVCFGGLAALSTMAGSH